MDLFPTTFGDVLYISLSWSQYKCFCFAQPLGCSLYVYKFFPRNKWILFTITFGVVPYMSVSCSLLQMLFFPHDLWGCSLYASRLFPHYVSICSHKLWGCYLNPFKLFPITNASAPHDLWGCSLYLFMLFPHYKWICSPQILRLFFISL
jgi:hypothetical protein